MTTTLLIALAILDLLLLAAIFLYSRRDPERTEFIESISEERRLLSEMQSSVRDELESILQKNKEFLEKISQLAAEAEEEVKSGAANITKEVTDLAAQVTGCFEQPLQELTKKQNSLEQIIRRASDQREVLQKHLARAEKIIRFFDSKISYKEILEEFEDKKYLDARSMLAKGYSVDKIAEELTMTESEVRLIAGLATR